MSERTERLRAYVAAAGDTAPVIGVDDCGPWVCTWIEREIGRKIVFPSYSTTAEAYAMAARAGGLVELVAPMLAAIPLWQTSDAMPGDVGIVRLSDRDTAVIFCGNGVVAIRDERRGVRKIQPRTVLRAWSI